MKILMLADRMESGGAETHIAMLTEGLFQRGVDVSLLSEDGTAARRLAEGGIPWRRLHPLKRDPWVLSLARRRLRRLQETERFDVLHAHGRLTAQLLRGCEGWRGTPLGIVTAHAAYPTGGLRDACRDLLRHDGGSCAGYRAWKKASECCDPRENGQDQK